MEFRTTIKVEPSELKINHRTPVVFTGSCFAASVEGKMAEGRMTTLVNPFGTVYNPVSIANTISVILEKRQFTGDDLYKYKDRYISLLHYTGFSSENPVNLLDRINSTTEFSHNFLEKAEFLFITFGTAMVYRLRETGMIVSNCHKLPANLFSHELLNVDEIVLLWTKLLDQLKIFNKGIRVVFTISPVRHLKDGAHINQVSKSVLFLAVEKLLAHPLSGGYFPAYEIMMDDLRDYRYYDEDMLHPSPKAIDYIWNAFSDCYLTPDALSVWHEVCRITRAMNHRFITDSLSARNNFAAEMLKLISSLESRAPWIDLKKERSHFQEMITPL